jgi:two-component system, OmpR family, alkaline phosphatase synthesis response regulator PhoP
MGKRILVVDDSETVLAVARDILERAGFEIVTALDAHDADQYIFCQDKPDLIVLDIMLPGLEGHTKAKALKANELTRNIPVLLLSSKPEDHVRRLVYESGADGYVRKPFTDEEIVTKIKEKLQEKS